MMQIETLFNLITIINRSPMTSCSASAWSSPCQTSSNVQSSSFDFPQHHHTSGSIASSTRTATKSNALWLGSNAATVAQHERVDMPSLFRIIQKFEVHSDPNRADALRALSQRFLDASLPSSEVTYHMINSSHVKLRYHHIHSNLPQLEQRFALVHFLLCASGSPTENITRIYTFPKHIFQQASHGNAYYDKTKVATMLIGDGRCGG